MYKDNIQTAAERNTFFRRVLCTGKYSQLVVMSLKVGEDIGEEVHESTDQIIFVSTGKALAMVDKETFGMERHSVLFIPAGTRHNITNSGNEELKLYTVYSPPEHAKGSYQTVK